MNRIFTILLALGLASPAAFAQTNKQASISQLIKLLEQQQEELRHMREQMEELNHQVTQLRKDGEMAFLDHSAIKTPAKLAKNLADESSKGKSLDQPLHDLADDTTNTVAKTPERADKKIAKKAEDEKATSKAQPQNKPTIAEKNNPKVASHATKQLANETPAEDFIEKPTKDLADTSAEQTKPEVNSSIAYNEARTLLDQKRFAEAEVALTQFIKKYPKDPMIVNAHYWLAETHYIRSDYAQAALKFGDAYQSYQDHKNSAYKEAAISKGPEIIFKLASSLYNIGKYKEARITLDELGKEFPKLPGNIKQQADLLRREIARKANQT